MAVAELAHDERRQRQDAERELRMAKRQHERTLREDMYMVLRAGLFDEAEAALLQRLDETGSARFDAVRDAQIFNTPSEVTGWIHDMITLADVTPKGGPLTAIQIAYSNTAAGGGIDPLDPAIEVTGYTDQFFPFSTASDDKIADAQLGTATPWQGAFDWYSDDNAYHALRGLGEANRTLLTYRASARGDLVWIDDRVEIAPDAQAEPVASLLMAVKFHRFVRDAVARVQVPFPLVVVADGNDELYIRAVHHRPRVR